MKEVNPHFEDYLFNWDQTFQFLVGGYGSSKSYHTALKVVLKLLQEKRTALVVREVFETHRDSTFSLFATIIDELGVQTAAEAVSSPMHIRFANGSRIIFKGMDNPAKLKSVNNISLIGIEECCGSEV
jgi:phage terminase large subunit